MGIRNSGRKPKPTALKLLQGNPGKRPLNTSEPKPPVGEVVKPATLSPAASLVWDEMAPNCLAMGTLTVVDVQSFESMCELQATMRQTSRAKSGKSLFTLEADSDDSSRLEIVIDAIVKTERETAAALRPYYAMFGLDPASRSRLHVTKDEAPVSKWAGALR